MAINVYYTDMPDPPERTRFQSRQDIISYFTAQGYNGVRSDLMFAWQVGIEDYFVTELEYTNHNKGAQRRVLFSCCASCLRKRVKEFTEGSVNNPRKVPCEPCKRK